MAALAVQPHVAEFLDAVMHDGSLELRLQEIGVPSGSPLVVQTLRSSRVRARTGVLVLAVRHPSQDFRTNPPPEEQIKEGEQLDQAGSRQAGGADGNSAVGLAAQLGVITGAGRVAETMRPGRRSRRPCASCQDGHYRPRRQIPALRDCCIRPRARRPSEKESGE